MSSLKDKKVLITGADGFIGSHLTEALIKEGAQVRALVYYNSWSSRGLLQDIKDIDKNCEIITGDIRDPHFCLNLVENQEFVFHLAALITIPYSYVAPVSFFETNIMGTVNLLEAARRNKKLKKFISTSTSETYGSALYSPMDENHPLQAQSPYAASKVGADKAAISYYLSFNTPVTILRPFNNFGPRQSARAVIPTIITQLLDPQIKKVKLGSLDPIRDYLYATDTASAFIKLATNGKLGEVYNAGSGTGYSIGQIYEIISSKLKINKEIQTDPNRIRPAKSEVSKLICDNTKIKKTVNWKQSVSFEKGIDETIDWIKNNQDLFLSQTYNI
jgi:NAD dependent epimerase/dehydratase